MKNLSLLLTLIFILQFSAKAATPDSIGKKAIKGYVFIMHKVEAKETLYSLARKYNVKVNELMEANPTKGTSLNLGDTMMIPTFKKAGLSSNQIKNSKVHKVAPGETLYRISKIYNIPVSDLKTFNALKSNELEPGQILQLEGPNYPQSAQMQVTQGSEDFNRVERRFNDMMEIEEEGLVKIVKEIEPGVLKKQALHRDAPIGTVVKISNKLNNRYVYVKVVGRIPPMAENTNVVIIISGPAAEFIDVKQPFLGQLRYGQKTK
jgi:LysM repeat protein